MNKKKLKNELIKLHVVMASTILLFVAISFYPAIKNMNERADVRQQINIEIESKLSHYNKSDEYTIINPSVESDMVAIENSVDSNVSNIEELDVLYKQGIRPSPYLYIAKKINNDEYEVFEAYTNITVNSDESFTSYYDTGTRIFTYDSGEFTNIKSNEYNKRMEDVGNRDVMGKFWYISIVIIFGTSLFFLNKINKKFEYYSEQMHDEEIS